MEDRSDPDHADELLRRVRELEEARAKGARLTAENEALRLRLDPAAKPRPAAPQLPAAAAAPAAGYRGEDRLVRLERDLDEANGVVANLGIENAILRSRSEPGQAARLTWVRPAGFAAAVLGGGAFLWFLTESAAMLVVGLLLAGLGWGLVTLMDRIKPDGSNPRTPPHLPPGGLGM